MSNIDKTLEEIIRRTTSDQPSMSDAQIFAKIKSKGNDEFIVGNLPSKKQIISVADQMYEQNIKAQKNTQ